MTAVLIALMVLASAAGLAVPGLYRDNATVTWGWYGNDWVTLLLAVPALTVAGLGSSERARLLRLGLLYFIAYNYAFYLFGAAFNPMFLVYAALVIGSTAGLVRALRSPTLLPVMAPLTPARHRAVAAYLLLTGLVMGAVHVAAAAGFLLTGQLPDVVRATGHPTNVVAALDLGMVVTPSILGAVWVWRQRPEGYLLAILVNVKGALYMPALIAATLAAARAGTGVDVRQAYLWAVLGLGCAASAAALLAASGKGGTTAAPRQL